MLLKLCSEQPNKGGVIFQLILQTKGSKIYVHFRNLEDFDLSFLIPKIKTKKGEIKIPFSASQRYRIISKGTMRWGLGIITGSEGHNGNHVCNPIK